MGDRDTKITSEDPGLYKFNPKHMRAMTWPSLQAIPRAERSGHIFGLQIKFNWSLTPDPTTSFRSYLRFVALVSYYTDHTKDDDRHVRKAVAVDRDIDELDLLDPGIPTIYGEIGEQLGKLVDDILKPYLQDTGGNPAPAPAQAPGPAQEPTDQGNPSWVWWKPEQMMD